MANPDTTPDFLAGVIEGFYGQPWTQSERLELFDWLAGWGLNTYLYAPKDDLKHRAIWRELYSRAEAEILSELIEACGRRNVRFIYALSPGLDIRYGSESDLGHLRKRFEQMLGLGCRNFALLFDDIPGRLDARDLVRWGSLAAAQCYVANELFRLARETPSSFAPGGAQPPVAKGEPRFLFCPTAYCGRMAERRLGGGGYLAIVGRELLPEIDVCWTGPEIISREITVAHVQELQTVLHRKPVIWDNLHANDYDGRRFYCGPYAGRPAELRSEVNGLLSNPNNEFPLNFVPLRTLAEFVKSEKTWEPRQAYLEGMREWLARFALAGRQGDFSEPAAGREPTISLEDLILFGDCYYLPHEEGPEAEMLYQETRRLLWPKLASPAEGQRTAADSPDQPSSERPSIEAFQQRAARLSQFCTRMTQLRDRRLFHALSRRIWELREELDLLEQFLTFQSGSGKQSAAFTSDFHLPRVYRGGMVARLQRLLGQHPDGAFAPCEAEGARMACEAVRSEAVV